MKFGVNAPLLQYTGSPHRKISAQVWLVGESLNDKHQKNIQQKRYQERITLEQYNITRDEAHQ